MKSTLFYMSLFFVCTVLHGMEKRSTDTLDWFVQRVTTSDPLEAEVEAFCARWDIIEIASRQEIAYNKRKNALFASVNTILGFLIEKEDTWKPGEIEHLFTSLLVPVYPNQTTQDAIEIFFNNK